MLKYKGNHNEKLLKNSFFLPCIHAFPCMFAYVSINNCKYFPFSLAKYEVWPKTFALYCKDATLMTLIALPVQKMESGKISF